MNDEESLLITAALLLSNTHSLAQNMKRIIALVYTFQIVVSVSCQKPGLRFMVH